MPYSGPVAETVNSAILMGITWGIEYRDIVLSGILARNIPAIDLEGLCSIAADYWKFTTVSDVYAGPSDGHTTHVHLFDYRNKIVYSDARLFRVTATAKKKIPLSRLFQDLVASARGE